MTPKSTIPYKFILLVVVFVVVDFIIDRVNHRSLMGDFQVYYGAATAISHNGQVYGALFSPGSGYYKYSPFVALMFYPFSILPYYVACVVNFVIISAATIAAALLVLHIFNTYVFTQPAKYPNGVLSVSILFICIHLARELGLGNVNMVLLLLLSLSVYFIIKNKIGLAGLLLALVIITKPFFIIIMIPLLMRRYFKTVFVAAFLLGVFALLPAVLFGINKDIDLHRQWLSTMLIHADAFPSPNTIGAVIRNSFPMSFSASLQYVVMVFFMLLYMVYVWANRMNEKTGKPGLFSNFIIEWFVLIAMTPSLFKTDTEHFLMTFPLIIFIVSYLFDNRSKWLTVLFVILALLYAGNSSDLLGAKLSMAMYNMGVLGISNLLLVMLAVFIQMRKSNTLKIPGLVENRILYSGE